MNCNLNIHLTLEHSIKIIYNIISSQKRILTEFFSKSMVELGNANSFAFISIILNY